MLKTNIKKNIDNPCDTKYHELFSCISNSLSNDDNVKDKCVKLHEDYNKCIETNFKKK